MYFSKIEQETLDIDWFAVDAVGHIIHFASCGGNLPASVASSQEDLAQIKCYLCSLPELVPAATIRIEEGQDKGGRYSCYINYACRGIYSFDKADMGHSGDPYYQLLAAPIQRLHLTDLPTEIATLLARTVLPFIVADLGTIDSGTIR
jgi:hypothetical protein